MRFAGAWGPIFALCVVMGCTSSTGQVDGATDAETVDASVDGNAEETCAGRDSACPPPGYATWPMPNPNTLPLPNPSAYQIDGALAFDQVTRLEWHKHAAVDSMTWSDAIAYCTSLKVSGGGWRLPSRIELISLIDFTRIPTIDLVFHGSTTSNDYFWSSTPASAGPEFAYSVYFGAGFTAYGNINHPTARVRCVRGGGPGAPIRFMLEADTVFDLNTRLHWQRARSPIPMTHQAAVDYCQMLALSGVRGWRLPTSKEIQTTVLEGQGTGPVVDGQIFMETPNEKFWTSSSRSNPNVEAAIHFNMRDGTTEESPWVASLWARCVQ